MTIIPLSDKYKYQVNRLLNDNTKYHIGLNKEFLKYVNAEFSDYREMNAHVVDDESNNFVIAIENDKVVGYILYKIREEYIAISDFYVNPKIRGKGVGRKLLDYITHKKFKNRKIKLRCMTDNKLALNFYLKYGFKGYGEEIGKEYKIKDYLLEYN